MAISLSATLPSGTDAQELSANSSGGARVGSSTSELVAFHGSTPTDQYATFSAPVSAVTAGFASTADFTTLITAVQAIRLLLIEKGLCA